MQSYLASVVFDTRAEAERAAADLRAAGVPDRALSVVIQCEARPLDGVTPEAASDILFRNGGHISTRSRISSYQR